MNWAPRSEEASTRWIVAKWLVLAGFVATILALAMWPERAGPIFWYAVVPLLPGVFLVNVELWRNVCPLATLNTLPGSKSLALPLTRDAARIATVVGITGLLLAIPARRVLLNTNGGATAMALGLFGGMALASGFRFERKAGFCNSVCPVLPVERLYGQRPLVVVENARCTPCRACTRGGCIDLGPERSFVPALGDGLGDPAWLRSPFGAFALAFPGIVLLYSITPDLPVSETPQVLARLALGGGASWVLLATLVRAFRVQAADAMVWSAAAAVGLYYWFAVGTAADTFSLSGAVELAFRVVSLGLVAWWTISALAGAHREKATLDPNFVSIAPRPPSSKGTRS